MFSNRQKLAAVLNKWAQPAIQDLIGSKLSGMPFLANAEVKLKSMGWVSPMWSIGKEIAPIFNGLSSSLVEPLIMQYLKGVPDEVIPQIAHNVVNDAIKHGGLSLFEGNVEFEVEDLEELRTLLRYNLPVIETDSYQVVTTAPAIEDDENEAKPNIPSA